MKIIKTSTPKPKIEFEPPIMLPEDGQTRGLLFWLKGFIK